jgi:hypothetical protein
MAGHTYTHIYMEMRLAVMVACDSDDERWEMLAAIV